MFFVYFLIIICDICTCLVCKCYHLQFVFTETHINGSITFTEQYDAHRITEKTAKVNINTTLIDCDLVLRKN